MSHAGIDLIFYFPLHATGAMPSSKSDIVTAFSSSTTATNATLRIRSGCAVFVAVMLLLNAATMSLLEYSITCRGRL